MGKNFDELRAEREARDRSFTIAGHEFRFRPAIPAHQYSLYLELMDRMSEGRWPPGSFDTLNATVLELLEPDQRDAWEHALANGGQHPISFEDISKIIEYAVEVNSGRPTTPPSASGSTAGSGGTRSTDASASPAAEGSPDLISGRF